MTIEDPINPSLSIPLSKPHFKPVFLHRHHIILISDHQGDLCFKSYSSVCLDRHKYSHWIMLRFHGWQNNCKGVMCKGVFPNVLETTILTFTRILTGCQHSHYQATECPCTFLWKAQDFRESFIISLLAGFCIYNRILIAQNRTVDWLQSKMKARLPTFGILALRLVVPAER